MSLCDLLCVCCSVCLLRLACGVFPCAGANKRKGGRPDLGHHDEYGSGRFGGQLDREMQFFEKVKQRLRSKEQYQDFLKCLNLYAQEIISRNELINLAQVNHQGAVLQHGTGRGGGAMGCLGWHGSASLSIWVHTPTPSAGPSSPAGHR